jgi:hypothetical protein
MKIDVMNHVNISELMNITAFRVGQTGKFVVDIRCLDPDKKVVIDPKALETMNNKITERAAQFEARDPKAKTYIEEFVSRMLPELHRVGLLEIVDIPDAPADPYAEFKKAMKLH